MAKNWPQVTFHQGMRTYILIQMGYHITSTFSLNQGSVSLFFETKYDSFFYQMVAHHIATMLSIVYSYFTNHEDYCVYILLLSSFADFFLNFSRFCRNVRSDSDTLKIVCYLLLTISWIYSRLLVMPLCFYRSTVRLYPYQPYPLKEEKFKEVW
jgi:hypothetical protein